jgi:RNA polymerase sigma-70 factor (ECF subfamily)
MHAESPTSAGDRPNPDSYDRFLLLFTRYQHNLLAYILALVHDRHDAQEIFQETSLVLWKAFPTFRLGAEFLPWALGIAKHQVLRQRRLRKRDRHVFSEQLMTMLAEEAAAMAPEIAPRQEALAECMKRLTSRQRQLIEWFYGKELDAGQIAQRWNQSIHAVYKALKVLRRILLECIERKLAEGCKP